MRQSSVQEMLSGFNLLWRLYYLFIMSGPFKMFHNTRSSKTVWAASEMTNCLDFLPFTNIRSAVDTAVLKV